eukprot:3555228-Rhodomonas_salina.2
MGRVRGADEGSGREGEMDGKKGRSVTAGSGQPQRHAEQAYSAEQVVQTCLQGSATVCVSVGYAVLGTDACQVTSPRAGSAVCCTDKAYHREQRLSTTRCECSHTPARAKCRPRPALFIRRMDLTSFTHKYSYVTCYFFK